MEIDFNRGPALLSIGFGRIDLPDGDWFCRYELGFFIDRRNWVWGYDPFWREIGLGPLFTFQW